MHKNGSQLGIQYTTEIPFSGNEGQSNIYVNPQARAYLACSLPSGAETLYESFKSSAKQYSNRPFLGARIKNLDGNYGPYQWMTYAEANTYITRVAWGLNYLNLTSPNVEGHSFIGIYSNNRPEWVLLDLACSFQSITSVPIYDTLHRDALLYIISETQMHGLACRESSTPLILDLFSEGLLPSLQVLIILDPTDHNQNQSKDLRTKCANLGLAIYSLDEVSNLCDTGIDSPPHHSSLYTICYTSGTTGQCKGVMLSHRNILASVCGILHFKLNCSSQDVYLSYLPLAHIAERSSCHYLIACGVSIGFYQGDISKIREDLASLRPTIFQSVPRLFNRFYELILSQLNATHGIKKAIVDRALASKRYYYRTAGTLTHKFWDALVFNKIREVLGGRVRIMATGSAPIAAEVLEFLRIVFCCPIVEAYGQTETSAASFMTDPMDLDTGIIGGPSVAIEVKFLDVVEMGYFSSGGGEGGERVVRGEICLRGPCVFEGYYRNEELTREAFETGGWLRTGDIGMRIEKNGAVRIIDRKKNFFKLQQGEYVALEKIEMVYGRSHFISQMFVYGDSMKNCLVAVVVPDENFIRKNWARSRVGDSVSFDEICKRGELKAEILNDMNSKAKEEKLLGFEVVKHIYLEAVPWTVNDLLTPTMKVMRSEGKKKYGDIISLLYSEVATGRNI